MTKKNRRTPTVSKTDSPKRVFDDNNRLKDKKGVTHLELKIRYWNHKEAEIEEYILDIPIDEDTGLIKFRKTEGNIKVFISIDRNMPDEMEDHNDRSKGLVIPPGGLIIKL